MNQIEFIKKHAKHGDRIHDATEAVWTISENPEFAVCMLDTSIGMVQVKNVSWQSPKIYRLGETHVYNKGYKEEWQLIADYADEGNKNEVDKRLSQNPRDFNESQTAVVRDLNERLKALEGKK